MTTRILLIDESFESLQSYRYALAPKAGQWMLITAETAEEGLQAAIDETPDIVIAALSTNEGQGPQILAKIEQIAPDAQRFITATETEKHLLQETFGSSFQFLPSPCPPNRLLTEIQRCVAIDTWLGNDRIKQLVSKMGEFPSLPPIYLKVVNALNSREASADVIAQAVAGDLAISAKVLQTVNSSYYGFDEKISNIAQAVGILGIECIKNLVLAIQVFNKLGRSPEQRAITDQLWHHSMSVAVAARRIAAHENKDEAAAEEAYTAGLMHDIGKLVLLNAAPEQFATARELAREKSIPLWQAEEEVIGSNHAEIGAYILARWGMPANISEAVALHHDPINSFGKSFSPLAAVHVANAIVHARQSSDHPSAEPSSDFLVEIGRSGSMDTWVAVASGKTIATDSSSEKKGLALKRDSDNASSSDNKEAKAEQSVKAPSKAQPVAATTEASSSTTESEETSPKSKVPLIAIAACLSAASIFGIYMFTKSSSDPIADLSAADKKEDNTPFGSNFADNIEAAREFSGMNRTEDALQEVFDAQDKPASVASVEKPADPKSEPAIEVAKAENEPAPQPIKLPQPKLPETKDSFPNIELAGIFFNSSKPLASVNGKIRRVGDMVEGAQIVRIEKSLIVVKYDNIVRSYKLN